MDHDKAQVSSDTFYPRSQLPKSNQHIPARTINDEWTEYTIISQAGKATQNYADWVNVYDENLDKALIGRKLSRNGRIFETKEVLIANSHSPETLEAMFKELKKMERLQCI